ncbi:toll-like receptor Tollo [Branchiostoma floridae]|uniref:Toll-like receptor Tollo n=1 Tax=Branchiostoma floridae TaxID=7739 RepID=A0A9J7KZS8_BRAFL|nr:toll-like receptor Tollo [Branchiostoma floridae]
MVQGEVNSTVAPWNERVDCSRRSLLIVPTDVPSLTTILHLEANSIRLVYRSAFAEGMIIKVLHLSHNNITNVESMAFSHLPFLEILYLDANNIDDIAGSEFLGIANLKELYLNRSRVRAIGRNAFIHLPSLKVLHLENNLLTTLTKDQFSTLTYLQRLALTGNSFRCDCDILWLKYWMKNKESIMVGQNISCTHLQSQVKETIQTLLEDTLGCNLAEAARKNKITISLSVVVVLLSLLIILGIWLYKRKEALQVYLYSRYGWRFREEQEDMAKPYDAFLSYSQHDLDFIIHTLLPGLETRTPPFRVCLHHRDFVPGILIADNILNAVEESRRTIVVISRHFLESEWCQLEFQAAHAQVLQDRANRLIMILLEDIPVDDAPPEIRHYLKTNTYLKWGDERFWERLVYVMPRPRPPELLVENMEEQLEMHEANEQEM